MGSIVVVRVVYLASVLLLLVGTWLPANVLDVVAVVVREGAAQVHHLLLAGVLQQLGDAVQLRQRIES